MGINLNSERVKIEMCQPFNSLDAATKDQMACTFAALLLHDEGTELTAANLNKGFKATNNNVAAYWPMLFCNALAGRSVGEFLAVSGGSAPAPTGDSGNAAPAQAAPEKKEVKKEEAEEEEEDMDIGDLFG